MKTNSLVLIFLALAVVGCESIETSTPVKTTSFHTKAYLYPEFSIPDSLFVIEGNRARLALTQDEASQQGLPAQMYNRIRVMIDTMNNRSDNLTKNREASRLSNGNMVLLNMNVLAYSFVANGQIICSPNVALPNTYMYNPGVAVVQCYFTAMNVPSTGTHELYVYSSGGEYVEMEFYGDVNFLDYFEGISWPVHIGYRYRDWGSDTGICIWYIYAWADDYWSTHPWY